MIVLVFVLLLENCRFEDEDETEHEDDSCSSVRPVPSAPLLLPLHPHVQLELPASRPAFLQASHFKCANLGHCGL
jgi:hypothetical protein